MRGLASSCVFAIVCFSALLPAQTAPQSSTPTTIQPAATPTLTPHASAPAAAALPAAASLKEPRGAYWDDAKFMQAWNEALESKRKRQYAFALDSFKKANKLSGDGCLKCLEQMYSLESGLGKYKDAVATAQHMEALAVTPMTKSIAQMDRGTALWRQGGEHPKPDQLTAAHEALTAALTTYPHNAPAEWADACVLAHLGRNDEASAAFASCAHMAKPDDPMRFRAEHFAADPKLSLSKMAPNFEVTTLDGSHFNLDQMNGKVVLIDFWATWCGPCNEELPHMRRIAKDFANEPLVIISISWDADEQKWKDFIGKNGMTWQQYRDADHTLSSRFDVAAIPHYFTIDSDGVLTAELVGSGSDVEGRLRKLIKKAKESRPVAVSSTAPASGTN